jgi:hypothetical protein
MKKGLLIKRIEDNKSIEMNLVEIDGNKSELHQIYDHLGVSLIDIVSYKNKSIYIDDEGLLKADPQLTLLLNDTNQYLYGNVLIMGDVDEEVETLGISSKEAEQLIRDIKIVKDLISNQELMLW